MRRLLISSRASALIILMSGFLATPVASAQQSVTIFVGGFVPRGGQLDSGTVTGRSADDELANNSDFLDFTVDRSTWKQGLLLPGTGIPVLDPAAIAKAKPEFVLILPWNLKAEIMASMAHIRSWGGKFIVPIPQPTILT